MVQGAQYVLVSAVVHRGQLGSGHYWAVVRWREAHGETKLLVYDDDTMQEADERGKDKALWKVGDDVGEGHVLMAIYELDRRQVRTPPVVQDVSDSSGNESSGRPPWRPLPITAEQVAAASVLSATSGMSAYCGLGFHCGTGDQSMSAPQLTRLRDAFAKEACLGAGDAEREVPQRQASPTADEEAH